MSPITSLHNRRFMSHARQTRHFRRIFLLPAPRDLRLSCAKPRLAHEVRSNSGYKPKKTSKTTSRHQNIVEYISGKSFLFISLKEKVDSTLFSVRRFQYFISHTKSLIFKRRLLRDTGGSSTIKDHASPMVCKLLYTPFLVTWVWVACGFAGYLLHTKQAFPFSHALRIRRICSSNETCKLRCNEQTKYLNRRGYNIGFLNQKSVNTITRTDALKSSDAITDSPTRIPLVAGYNPALPSISSIFHKYAHTLSSFQRCATVSKSIPLVPFRSTNKPIEVRDSRTFF